ncbi:MAG: flagellar biosynthesis protein FlhA [Bryobacteraceae bacterium]|nr:flagellar biosynthesis protein FlhA [Bryobacteraceae bacterium]
MASSTTSVAPVGSQGPRDPIPPPHHSGPKAAKALQGDSVVLTLTRLPWKDMAVPLAVLSIVLAMITPLPSFLVDVLISANITLSVIVLLVAMYITRPAEFSVFPTTLLLLTLFRLALNISSSRLILLNGNSGTAAAGHVIEAFGSFVVGGNYIIGTVIFLVLVAIQYVVINHGAVRISEVTARFTLDALPGKQMSIDSDLNAGLIDESEARTRRKQLAAEAEFYGAMDGASRFTQRDAIASILITGINIIAGFLIGVLQHGMELRRALETYTVLTIGDGLVTVIPALMISVSGGLIVTRTSSEERLGSDLRTQMFTRSQPLLLAAGVLIAMAAFPGLPKIPFLLLGGGVGYAGWQLRRKEMAPQGRAGGADAAAKGGTGAPAKENLETLLKVEPLAIEVGLGLVKLVEGGANSVLLRRIAGIRRQLAADLGYLLPPVRVTDNLQLRAGEYAIQVKGVEVSRFELPQGVELAIASGRATGAIQGTPTKDPAFGLPAFWISADAVEQARRAGYTVVDGVSVLTTHLGEVIRRHAHEIFSRQDAKQLLDRVSEENPRAVEDLVPKLLSLAVVQKVLQNLLRERASIRDATSILEALGEAASVTRNPVLLTEFVRQSVRRMIVKPYLNPSGDLPAWFLDAPLERDVEGGVEHTENVSHLALAPQRIREIVDKIAQAVGAGETTAVLLTSSGARYFLRQMVEPSLPGLVVLSHNEVPPGVKVLALGIVR